MEVKSAFLFKRLHIYPHLAGSYFIMFYVDHKIKVVLFVLLIFALFLSFRIPYINMVLGHDQAGWMCMSDKILEGKVLYKDIFSDKLPGIHFIYTFIIYNFGKSVLALRLFLLFYSLITMYVFYVLTKCLYNRKVASFAILFFSFYSGVPVIEGFEPFVETFLILPVIISIFLLLLGEQKSAIRYFFASGLFHGIAFEFKQIAIYTFASLFIFMLIDFSFNRTNKKYGEYFAKLTSFTVGFLFPQLIVIIYFLSKNATPDLYFCAIVYPSEICRAVWHDPHLLNRFLYGYSKVIIGTLPIWIMSIVTMKIVVLEFRTRNNILIFLLTLFSIFGVSTVGTFSGHYFILLIPFLCILAGYGFDRILQGKLENRNLLSNIKLKLLIVFIVFSFLVSMTLNILYYFSHPPYERNKNVNTITDLVKTYSEPEDYVYVWGIANEIYYHAGRKYPSKYIDNQPFTWLRNSRSPKMLSWLIDDLVHNKPKLIIDKGMTMKNIPLLYQFVQAYYFPVENIYVPADVSAILIFEKWFFNKDYNSKNVGITIYKRRN